MVERNAPNMMASRFEARSPCASSKAIAQAPAQLSRRSFLVCLAMSVGLFLCFNPLGVAVEIGELDRGIWLSYGLLPMLSALFLKLERKYSAAAMFLETLKLVLVKFVLTYSLASLGWILSGPPLPADHDRRAYAASLHAKPFSPLAVPSASALDPAQLGGLEGRVLDASGQPMAGALVYVSEGLSSYRFSPPANDLELRAGRAGCSPEQAVLSAYQGLLLRSDDSTLHTLQMTAADGRSVLNHPVLPGSERRLMFEHALGLLTLTCRVHGAREPSAKLLITNNPFYVYTDASGAFQLEGIPAGALKLVAWSQQHAARSFATRVEAGKRSQSIELRLQGELR